jgi:hypothetical protein
VLQAAIQSCVLTIGSKSGTYNLSNRLAVTRLTRVLSANGQNPIGADKDATVSALMSNSPPLAAVIRSVTSQRSRFHYASSVVHEDARGSTTHGAVGEAALKPHARFIWPSSSAARAPLLFSLTSRLQECVTVAQRNARSDRGTSRALTQFPATGAPVCAKPLKAKGNG